jgi:hypothetical protein
MSRPNGEVLSKFQTDDVVKAMPVRVRCDPVCVCVCVCARARQRLL